MIVKRAILISLFLALPAMAIQAPPTPCDDGACTPRMLQIADAFSTGTAVSGIPFVASGECYHLSSDLDPSTTHYGVIYLDTQNDQIFMQGRFAFFYSQNPYQDWDLARARTEFPDIFTSKNQMELGDDFAYINLDSSGEDVWEYWLRRKDQNIYLIGQWGKYHRVFCELKPTIKGW